VAQFAIGQFFTEWQVALSTTNIGGLTADQTHLFKTTSTARPTPETRSASLRPHDEIALA
jgi:hypothetical protein